MRVVLLGWVVLPLSVLRALPIREESAALFVGCLLLAWATWIVTARLVRSPWLRGVASLIATALVPSPYLIGLLVLYFVVLPFASRNRGVVILSVLVALTIVAHPIGLLLVGLGAQAIWASWSNKSVAVLAFLSLPGWVASPLLVVCLAAAGIVFDILLRPRSVPQKPLVY